MYVVYRYVLHNEDGGAKYGLQKPSVLLTDAQIKTLELHFPYYNSLLEPEKEIFRKRLAYFIKTKHIVGLEGLDLFDSMKALLCAEAIKLTFGLDKFILPHFKLIRVFPEEYYSRITGAYHKGEVNLNGSITLSWKNFEEGIIDRQDGINVAIHEFAHAVYFENFIKNNNYLFINPVLIKKWNELAALEMPNVQNNDNHFIRAYGGTNLNEFFAVSSEHFFEQPVDFQIKHPELYKLLTLIYNQDPIARIR